MKDDEYECYKCKGTGRISHSKESKWFYKCKGTGRISHSKESKWFYECIIKCPLCKGTGKLDWISNIIKPKYDGRLEVIVPYKPDEMIELEIVIDNKTEQKKE